MIIFHLFSKKLSFCYDISENSHQQQWTEDDDEDQDVDGIALQEMDEEPEVHNVIYGLETRARNSPTVDRGNNSSSFREEFNLGKFGLDESYILALVDSGSDVRALELGLYLFKFLHLDSISC